MRKQWSLIPWGTDTHCRSFWTDFLFPRVAIMIRKQFFGGKTNTEISVKNHGNVLWDQGLLWISKDIQAIGTWKNSRFRKSNLADYAEEGEDLRWVSKSVANTVLIRGRFPHPCQMNCKGGFQPGKTNEKWLTDITEFTIPAGKVYSGRT